MGAVYPDAYEVGLPNQGIAILYEVLNEQPGVLAERTYSVWPDLERLMRERGIPQFTVDAHRPVGAFDLLGVSFSTELGYTNLLTALDLAGIPIFSAQRTVAHPLVIAGGHAAFNPEPIADFLDAVVLGDGEEAVLAVTRLVRDWKRDGCPAAGTGCWLSLAAHWRHIRAAVLRRALPGRRPDRAGGAEPAGRPRVGHASTR